MASLFQEASLVQLTQVSHSAMIPAEDENTNESESYALAAVAAAHAVLCAAVSTSGSSVLWTWEKEMSRANKMQACAPNCQANGRRAVAANGAVESKVEEMWRPKKPLLGVSCLGDKQIDTNNSTDDLHMCCCSRIG
jgi:hypothetical protein